MRVVSCHDTDISACFFGLVYVSQSILGDVCMTGVRAEKALVNSFLCPEVIGTNSCGLTHANFSHKC